MNGKLNMVEQQFSNIKNMMAKITTLCSYLIGKKKKRKEEETYQAEADSMEGLLTYQGEEGDDPRGP